MLNYSYLINEEKIRSKGKSDSARAVEYYYNQGDRFLAMDTLWLVPLMDTMEFRTIETNKRDQIIFRDTSSFRPIINCSDSLPDEIKGSLLRAFREAKGKKTFIGPLSGQLGTWYFAIKKVHAGKGKIPFGIAKETIRREMEVQNFPFDSIAKTESGAQLLDREILYSAYHTYVSEEINALSDEKVQKLIADGKIKVSYDNNNKSDKRLLMYARQKVLFNKIEQDHKKIDEWIKSLTINRDLLLSGCINSSSN